MKTFNEYLTEDINLDEFNKLLNESEELTTEDEAKIDEAVNSFLKEHQNGKDLETLMNELIEEGVLGSVFGGLTGFALGKSIGKLVAKVLGIEKGVLYDLLTSRLVGAALGSAIGKKF